MRQGRWDCCSGRSGGHDIGIAKAVLLALGRWEVTRAAALLALLALLVAWPVAATAQDASTFEPPHAEVIVDASDLPPAADDPRWKQVPLVDAVAGTSAWYRVRLDFAAQGPTMLYLPYFYGGGRIHLNGQLVAEVPRTSASTYVRWGRPMLFLLPATALKAQANTLLINAHTPHDGSSTSLSRLVVGAQSVLQPMYERRLFFVRTVPIFTWVTGSTVGLLILFIWLRRREEVLYGLFGLMALVWAQRTSTFVLEALPAQVWDVWRVVYHLCSGGLVVVMALFVLNLAGWSRRSITRGLIAYWALGPIVFIVFGDSPASQIWTAGFMLVGLGMLVAAIAAAWRRRTAATLAMAGMVVLTVFSGTHDQLLATRSPLLLDLWPEWSSHRLFLMHHAANVVLMLMGVLLALRFVGSLQAVEEANRTLEARVKEREREIASNYERIAELQREQATTDERQRIMRDLHDGLGSQLFTSLSRVERGAMDSRAMADTLRGAIDQMRVTIEALATEEQDLQVAFGNFRFRWDARLREIGITPTWDITLPDSGPDGKPALEPHEALQVMHIIQEALTNVVKHAHATAVSVHVSYQGGELAVDVVDNGVGASPVGEAPDETKAAQKGGRGQNNMRLRARRLGGEIEWHRQTTGTRVSLRVPWLDRTATS
jgi:signal transduction histidine kinase